MTPTQEAEFNRWAAGYFTFLNPDAPDPGEVQIAKDAWEAAQKKLLDFYKEVADLTVHHGYVKVGTPASPNQPAQEYDFALVSPSDLNTALEKVDPNWSRNLGKEDGFG
jgi:hypothetical protein